MRFIDVRDFYARGAEIQIDLIGEDHNPYPLVMDESVATLLLLAIQQAATLLQPDQSPIREKYVCTVAKCQPIAVEHHGDGILITTHQGIEISLVVGPQGRSALRTCIDQIERGIDHGPVH
jgi:hypothetical protein